jgi:type III secretory pathway component EscV
MQTLIAAKPIGVVFSRTNITFQIQRNRVRLRGNFMKSAGTFPAPPLAVIIVAAVCISVGLEETVPNASFYTLAAVITVLASIAWKRLHSEKRETCAVQEQSKHDQSTTVADEQNYNR